jgi:hypothetical protein
VFRRILACGYRRRHPGWCYGIIYDHPIHMSCVAGAFFWPVSDGNVPRKCQKRGGAVRWGPFLVPIHLIKKGGSTYQVRVCRYVRLRAFDAEGTVITASEVWRYILTRSPLMQGSRIMQDRCRSLWVRKRSNMREASPCHLRGAFPVACVLSAVIITRAG